MEKKHYLALGMLVFLVAVLAAYAYSPYAGSGERFSDLAKQILRPIGWVVAVWKGYQAWTNEHNRMQNIGTAIGGAMVGGWDYTIALFKWILGIG